MRIKYFILVGLLVALSNSYSETIKADTNEVEIDLNNNVLTAQDGIILSSKNIKGVFHKLERDPETEDISFSKNALVNLRQDSGNIKIETEKGKMNREKEIGEFYNNFAYINVAKTTGAEAPNDKIYFGSPYIKYEDEKIHFKDGWITTDFSIVNFPKNPEEAGYHLISKDTLIEPDKQITLHDTNLFLKDKDVTPFTFPWYRVNIRKDSRVPLFPTFSSSNDYGFETMWGFLYGNRKDKFRGGIAPKFSDKTGWLIGRWENWYKSKLGETRLNIDDLQLYSKVKKDSTDNIGNIINYEKRYKRYKVSLTHDYSGEKGNFNFSSTNSTRSQVGKLKDVMEKLDNNSVYKTWGIDREKYDKNIGFYSLKSDLSKLGPKKDISLNADLSLTSDKKGYGLIVYDSIDDIGYGSKIDHDLYSKISLKQDNSRYILGANYSYLYDMDPGSTNSDLKSRDESINLKAFDKKTGFKILYDKTNSDEYRNLSLWERDIKTKLKKKNSLGIDFNYVPTTVSKYQIKNKENLKVALGVYGEKSYIFEPELKYTNYENKLDLTQDEYRKDILGNNRGSNYNRFENIIYDKKTERRADFNLYDENHQYIFSLGKTEQEIWDREGLYDGTYRNFRNDSNFYEFLFSKINMNAGKFGKFAVQTKLRRDDYKNSSDKLDMFDLRLRNDLNVYEKGDSILKNKLSLELQKYSYSGNEENKRQRTINKDDYYKVEDKISFENSKVNGTLKTSYKEAKDTYHKNINNKVFSNVVSLNFKNNKKVSAFYTTDKRYTSETISGRNYNDLSKENYGLTLNSKKHSISGTRLELDYLVDDVVSSVNLKEKITEDKLSYSYKNENNKITLSYGEGKTKSNKYMDTRNTDYSVLYGTFNEDAEQDIYLSYSENRYNNSSIISNIRNTDTYKFSYEYRDKKFEKSELMKYATLEYVKPENEVTLKDIEGIKNILDRKRDFNKQFELTRISDESFKIGNYKKSLKFYMTIEKNNRRYSQTGDLRGSLSKLEGGLTYTYNRFGLGYKFKEVADWKKNSGGYSWKKESREHELSTYAKIGKPSSAWKIKTYTKFYENLEDEKTAKSNRKRALDGVGIEIGKEMGYYEWAVSYENKYSPSTKDYEWRAGVHFTLLTFPNDSIFGFGAKNSGSRGVQTRPDGYILNRPEALNKK